MPFGTFSRNYTKLINISIFCLLFGTVLPVRPLASFAEDFQINPLIGYREEFDDNIVFSVDEKQYDFISTISPGLEIINRSERLDVGLASRIDSYFYKEHSKLNDTDQNYSARFDYNFIPRMKIHADYEYVIDNRIDRDIDTSGLLLGAKREKHELSNSIDFQVNEITSLGLSYNYSSETYDEKDLSALSYNNQETHSITFFVNRYSRIFSQQLLTQLYLGYARYNFENEDSVAYYSATVGVAKELNEKFSLNLNIGIRPTRSTYNELLFNPNQISFVKERVSNDLIGGIGSAALIYQGELCKWDISASHDLQTASGRYGAVERTTLAINVMKRINFRLTFYFNTKYFINGAKRGETAAEDIDEETFRLGPWMRYKLKDKFFFDVSYSFTQLKNNERGYKCARNQAYIGITYKLKLLN